MKNSLLALSLLFLFSSFALAQEKTTVERSAVGNTLLPTPPASAEIGLPAERKVDPNSAKLIQDAVTAAQAKSNLLMQAQAAVKAAQAEFDSSVKDVQMAGNRAREIAGIALIDTEKYELQTVEGGGFKFVLKKVEAPPAPASTKPTQKDK